MTTLGPPIWPLPTPSQGFFAPGSRTDSNGNDDPHNGTDWPGPVGTPLHAMSDGTVSQTGGPAGDSGNFVIVLADDGSTRWSFSHMEQPSAVGEGGRVALGQVLGTIGLTGNTTGGHVHVHVSVDRVDVDPESLTDPDLAGESSGFSGTGLLVAAAVGGIGFALWRMHRT